jgi:hypothetical protein
MRITLAVLFLFLLALLPKTAHAEPTDPAAADVLFQKGRDAMAEQDYETACQMFEESLAFDLAVGTVMNLAVCEEDRGQFTAAWERWRQAIRLLGPADDRIDFATQKLESVAARLSYLTIRLAPNAPSGLTIKRDTVVLGKASLGEELPANPGELVVTVEGKHHQPKTFTISLESGEHRELVVAPGPVKVEVKKDTTDHGRAVRRTAGFVGLGIGAVGVGALVVTAALLPAQHSKVEENCPNKMCNDAGWEAMSGVNTLLAINTAGWITAGVGLISGTVLLITLPSNKGSGSKQPRSKHSKAEGKPGGGASPGHKRAFFAPQSLTVAATGSGFNISGKF